MKSLYEELGGTYRQVGDYFIPDIELPERNYEIGKYGRMRHRYLKEHRKIQYTTMTLDGTLYDHLEEIDRICNDRIETMVIAMKKQQGISEELKARDQLVWVGAMNNIRSHFETYEELATAIEQFIHYYNHQRRQHKLNCLPPATYRSLLEAA